MWVEKHRGSFRVRDLVGGRKVTIRSGYATKTAANAAKATLLAEKLRGDALVPGGGRLTLDAFIDAWWPSYERSLKPTTVASEGRRIHNHIRPLLGDMHLEDL